MILVLFLIGCVFSFFIGYRIGFEEAKIEEYERKINED